MADITFNAKKLIGVEYPGIVKNVEKMLYSLGGEKSLSKVYSEPSRRLELRYRPNDIYCKCGHGDRFNTTNLLMKVVRKKVKRAVDENSLSESSDCYTYRVDIIGIVDTTYRFKGMMDFQYLPMKINPGGQYRSLIPSLVPTGIQLCNWLQKEAEIFIQPPLFSRLDMPTNYHYRRDPTHRNSSHHLSTKHHPPNIIGRTRKRRSGFAIFMNFEDKRDVPQKPADQALKQIKLHHPESDIVEKVQKLFQERPVWSRNALVAVMGCERTVIKFILPIFSYYHLTGPWRSFWVRFQYDPRKDPLAKQYQTLDFRVKLLGPSHDVGIKSKRSAYNYKLPTKFSRPGDRVATIQTQSFSLSRDEEPEDKHGEEEMNRKLSYKFIPGLLPPCRQMFYQLCDIEEPKVQALVHQNDDQSPEECHPKEGWCVPGVLEQCREIMQESLQETLKKIRLKTHEETSLNEAELKEEEDLEDLEDDAEFSDQEIDAGEIEEVMEYMNTE
ncbi:general transcription factor 3C polypeptide 5-like [Limulus polyphemus]|uniref:General transcription factor 3C polypeptide 5-like n=1 Tax=Limulus polyphemus TaxID=6850 RepID=A0ABM1BTB9_LIMPO|nr:general transcription factor 3C polypeptide 5-like [Limulus polyphemus]